MEKKENDHATTAQLIENLFRTKRRPDGREYTYKEISETLNGSIEPSHLSKLRSGKITNPGRETLLALCQFFHVSPLYFFPEVDMASEEESGDTANHLILVALRSARLNTGMERKLAELIDVLRSEEGRP